MPNVLVEGPVLSGMKLVVEVSEDDIETDAVVVWALVAIVALMSVVA